MKTPSVTGQIRGGDFCTSRSRQEAEPTPEELEEEELAWGRECLAAYPPLTMQEVAQASGRPLWWWKEKLGKRKNVITDEVQKRRASRIGRKRDYRLLVPPKLLADIEAGHYKIKDAIKLLVTHTPLTQSEIAIIVGCSRSRVSQVTTSKQYYIKKQFRQEG